MALFQLLGLRQQVVDNAGNPLAGGAIHIFAPNTATRITSYSDSGLVNANPNPVILSGSGRASIWLSRNADIRVEGLNGVVIAEETDVNPESIIGGFDSGLIPNGSFETDADANDIPDGWSNDVNDPGSNNGIDTTESTNGGQSWRTQSAGSGGGELVTTDFFPVNDVDSLRVSFDLRSTVASGIQNIVRVEWYDVSQTSISNTDVYSTTVNPTTFTSQDLLANPPTGARFGRLRIIGGGSGGQIAGITYWDNFRVFYPLVVAGVFDNITISGNDITSTNTNGPININPDGTGTVELQATTNVSGSLDVTGNMTVDTNSTLLGLVQCRSTSSADLADGFSSLSCGGLVTSSHMEFDSNTIQSKANATTADLLNLNQFGGSVLVGPQSGAGSVILYDNGSIMVETSSGGMNVRGSSDNTVTIDLDNTSGARRASFAYNTSDTLDITNHVVGGGLELAVTDTGPSEESVLTAAAGGAVNLHFNGVSQVRTQDHNTGSAVTGVEVEHVNGGFHSVGILDHTFDSVGSATIDNTVVDRVVRITAASSTITFAQDADIPEGGSGWILNESSTSATLSQGSGVTITWFDGGGVAPPTGDRTLDRAGSCRWFKLGFSDYYIVGGDGVT